ncbi:hypothetical protein ABEB36_015812 [Hypothenemus hampei]|uniref:Uncharacterized protein n=1 Tax=Hypothenemus hampei TaxID=57062 RepID=A0ABD1DYQ2_HYPHA
MVPALYPCLPQSQPLGSWSQFFAVVTPYEKCDQPSDILGIFLLAPFLAQDFYSNLHNAHIYYAYNNGQINEACQVKPQKPIQKLKELAINEPREITCAKCVSGKFGTQILIELDDCVVFLPKRVAAALTNQVDALKGRRIVFRGMKKINNHYEQTDFEFLEPL